MRKGILALLIVFLILTLAGGVYVIANHGMVSAGYAVIPMLFTLICLSLLNSIGRKK